MKERDIVRREYSDVPGNDSDYSGKIHIICPRHGEPQVYGDSDSSLTVRGFFQTRKFTNRLIRDLSSMPANPKQVRVVWGDRRRSEQTGGLIHRQLADKIRRGQLPNVELRMNSKGKGHEFPLFGPGETLGPLIENGIPKNQSLYMWRTLDKEVLRQLGAVSPDEFAVKLDRFIHLMSLVSDSIREKQGPEIFYVGVSSETAHGALWNKIYPERRAEQLQINYAEPFEIIINGSQQNPVFLFRDYVREYPLNMSGQSSNENKLFPLQSSRTLLDNGA